MEKEDKHRYKRHNKILLLYHIVLPIKYRRSVLTPSVEASLKDICLELGKRYEMQFVEIGSDDNHVHFLVQSVPNLSVSDIIRIIKSITAKQLFKHHPEVKEMLWGGNFWTSGFYANTVGQYGNETMIRNYIEKQGIQHYNTIYKDQLKLL